MSKQSYKKMSHEYRKALRDYARLSSQYAMSDRLASAESRAREDSGLDHVIAPPVPVLKDRLFIEQRSRRAKFKSWKKIGSRVNSPTYRAWWFKPINVCPIRLP